MRLWTALLMLATLGACRSSATGPYSPPAGGARQTADAEGLTKEAAEIIGSDPEGAEKLLREALTSDLFFGPAHNNLGVLHLKRGELYEAASEFEWARKLMPGHPDPRIKPGAHAGTCGTIERGDCELLSGARGLPRVSACGPGPRFTDASD